MGFGDYVTRDIPTVIPNLNNVTSCYAGSYSSMIVLSKILCYKLWFLMISFKIMEVFMCLEITNMDN